MTVAIDLIDKITDLVDQLIEAVALLIPILLFIVFILGIFRLVDLYICEQEPCFLPRIKQSNSISAF